MSAKTRAAAVDEFASALRSSGLRVTQPRLAVLAVLKGARHPLSHAELIDALEGQGFDRVTLYRNLNDLAEVGMLVRTEVGDRVWRFEMRADVDDHTGQHPHFTCTQCGTVSCLPHDAVRLSSKGRLPRALREHSVEVSVRGLCDRCN